MTGRYDKDHYKNLVPAFLRLAYCRRQRWPIDAVFTIADTRFGEETGYALIKMRIRRGAAVSLAGRRKTP